MATKGGFLRAKQVDVESLTPGFYTYHTAPDSPDQFRLHLRVEPDGEGIERQHPRVQHAHVRLAGVSLNARDELAELVGGQGETQVPAVAAVPDVPAFGADDHAQIGLLLHG